MATKVSKLKKQGLSTSSATITKEPKLLKEREWKWWDQDKGKLTKLEHAFATGCTDAEACSYAGISARQLYYYQEINPYFVSRKQELKDKIVLKSRELVVNNIQSGDVDTAKWYLERKVRDEFGRLQFPEAPSGAIEEIAKLAKNFNELIENVKRKNTNSTGREGDLPKVIEPVSVERGDSGQNSD